MSDDTNTGLDENLTSDVENLETEETVEETPELTVAEKKRIKQLAIKYNGKEYTEELPFEIDEEHADYMRRQIQLAKLSQSKAQEAAALEKEVVSFLQELKTNPRKALANPMIGIDIKQLAAEILEEEIANSQKSPEQLKIEEYERKLKEIEEQRTREKEEQERRSYEATLERAYEKYDNMLASALDSNPDLPTTPYIVDKMTKYMSIAVEEGYEPDMEAIANIVREEVNNDVKHLLTVLPPEKVEAILGQEVLGKLRKNRLANAKKPPVPVKSAVKDVAPTKKEEPKKQAEKITMKQFFGV